MTTLPDVNPTALQIDVLHARDGTKTTPRVGDVFLYHESSGTLQCQRFGRSLDVGVGGGVTHEVVFVPRNEKERVLASIRTFLVRQATEHGLVLKLSHDGRHLRATVAVSRRHGSPNDAAGDGDEQQRAGDFDARSEPG